MGITTISHLPRALSPHLTCLCPWRTLYILTCRRPPPCHLPCLSGRGSDPLQPRALPLWQLFRATSCPVPAHCQTQAHPCLRTLRPPAPAQSPLCPLHNEEPARHLSLTPVDEGSRNSALPTTGTLPQPRRGHHYVRKAPAPPKPPARLPGAFFISDYSRTFVSRCF